MVRTSCALQNGVCVVLCAKTRGVVTNHSRCMSAQLGGKTLRDSGGQQSHRTPAHAVQHGLVGAAVGRAEDLQLFPATPLADSLQTKVIIITWCGCAVAVCWCGVLCHAVQALRCSGYGRCPSHTQSTQSMWHARERRMSLVPCLLTSLKTWRI